MCHLRGERHLTELAAVLGGYLIGAIPFAYLIGRWRRRDLRRLGTGNLGASNAYRQVGKLWGALVLALDLGKGLLPMLLLQSNWDSQWAPTLWALSAFVGHCWPVWLGFQTTGRGIAVLAGMFLAFGVSENTLAYVLGSIAGYGAGLLVGRPGFSVLAMVCGAILLAALDGAGAPVVFGSLIGGILMLTRRAMQLPAALQSGVGRATAFWMVLADDTVPGQSL